MHDDAARFLNVIDVDAAHQAELVDLVREGRERAIRHRTGFQTATGLASGDGRRVVSVAHWTSPTDAAATEGDPAAGTYAQRFADLGSASPGLYRVVCEVR